MSSQKRNAADLPIRNPIHKLPPAHPQSDWGSEPSMVIHRGVFCKGPNCHGLQEPVRGVRYKCSICPIDLCDQCIRQDNNVHDEKHMMFECPDESEFMETNDANTEQLAALGYLEGVGPSEVLNLNKLSIENGTGATNAANETLTRPNFIPQRPVQSAVKYCKDPLLLDQVNEGLVVKYDFSSDKLRDHLRQGVPAIRLVDLQPGGPDDNLRCTLRTVRLDNDDEARAFEVLRCNLEGLPSEQGAFIYAGHDEFVEITLDLSNALRERRNKERVATLWVQELCVDSDNEAEKAFCSKSAGLIYHRASRIILWTGCGDDQTDTTFYYMELLATECGCEDRSLPTPDAVNDNAKFDLDIVGSPEWLSLVQFLSQPVFEHGWLLHHIACFHKTFVKRGACQVDWKTFYSVARLLSQPTWLSEAWRLKPAESI